MRVAIHAFDGITMFHLATPLMVFGEVTRLGLAADWSTVVWTDDGEGVRTSDGVSIGDVHGPEVLRDADLIVFPSWPSELPSPPPRMVQLIRDSHAHGVALAGLCLGAFPLAHSGILDGRAAVTHWARADALQAQRPQIEVDASALYIDHGDVLTSAGTASALDACLHIVRTALGSAAALRLARQLVIAPHREGDQAQFIKRPVADGQAPDTITTTIKWALEHLDQPLSLDQLAVRAHLSKRTFSRRFHEAVGSTPASWVRSQRLDAARSLLETTNLSIAEVARAVGFDNTVTFRQRFAAAYATTPSSYRQRFCDPRPAAVRATGSTRTTRTPSESPW